MKRLFTLIIFFGLVWAQKPLFTEYVTGTAQSNEAQVMFYLQNVSRCVLEEVQVRVSHNKVYNSTDSTTFVTNLQPDDQETFVLRLSQVVSEGWGWTVDTIRLAEPEGENDCSEAGLIEFDKVVFEGAEPPAATPAAMVSEGAFMTYTVATGDSWFGIASRYGTTPEVIASMNDRSVDTLVVGEVIKVPAPSTISVPEPVATVASPYPVHTIVAGDTLYALAQTYNTDVKLILQANCLTQDAVLSVGQQVQIPPMGSVLGSCQ
jgi:LysM repeat protein